jgi:hypothetical protein
MLLFPLFPTCVGLMSETACLALAVASATPARQSKKKPGAVVTFTGSTPATRPTSALLRTKARRGEVPWAFRPLIAQGLAFSS